MLKTYNSLFTSQLSQDYTIKICRHDKGNDLIILDASNYNTMLTSIIRDKTKFLEIEYDSNEMQHSTVAKENSVTCCIITLYTYKKFKDGKT